MGDVSEQKEGGQEHESKSGGGRLIIIIIGFVVLIGVIGVVAMMVMGGSSSKDKDQLTAPIAKMEEPGYMFKFPEPFTGNLAAPDNDFVFSANVTLEIKPRGEETEEEALKEIGIGEGESTHNKMPYVRRIIMEEVGSKTRMELTSSTGKERIANTIKNNLDNILEKAQIKEVFLEIFVN